MTISRQTRKRGREEFDSSRQHVELLKEAGFEVESPFVGIPTVFRARKGKGTAKVALLAEYDALLAIGHAYGHNVSGAMSTLAAMTLEMMTDGELRKAVKAEHKKSTQV